MLVAFAIAIALHEVVAGLIPAPVATPPPAREVVARVTIARIAITPTPLPTPAPQIVSRARTIATIETQLVLHTVTGERPRKEAIQRAGASRPKPPEFSAKPVWDIPVGAQGAGVGSRSGAGSAGLAGNGAGNSGNGNGATAATEPCGFVDFSDPHGSRFDPGTHGFWVDIRMTVHFPDGHAESILLDYPWYYAGEASNPWSDQNLRDPGFLPAFQPPPPDKRANEPALVQYVMTHSSREGLTLLRDCPSPSPSA